MKGVVFNILNEMVEEQHGLEAWQSLLDSTGLDGIYVATETYPDEELFSLVGAAAEKLNVEIGDLVPAFGRYMIPTFVRNYPVFFAPDMTLKDFLLTVDEVVHVEVKKLYPEAGLPEFQYEDDEPDRLTMIYRSPRKLCALAEGLIAGAAEHFNEHYTLQHDVCMHKGSDQCEFRMQFNVH